MSVNRYLLGAYVLGGLGEDVEPTEEALQLRAAGEIDAVLAQQMEASPNALGPSEAHDRVLPSELPGVSDEAWTAWVLAMKVAEPTTTANNGALGMWAMKPRRLADLGFMTNVSAEPQRKNGLLKWDGEWTAPLTKDAFLSSPSIQYRILTASTKLYADGIADGSIVCPDEIGDEGVTLSGALALLQKFGPHGLERWTDVEDRKPQTIELFKHANGLF
jgi:hypothetical protein